jgi:hypothetical protein
MGSKRQMRDSFRNKVVFSHLEGPLLLIETLSDEVEFIPMGDEALPCCNPLIFNNQHLSLRLLIIK